MAGSLLDDNQWHDVEVRRNERDVVINVDRMKMENVTLGEFIHLDLDRKVRLLGVGNSGLRVVSFNLFISIGPKLFI